MQIHFHFDSREWKWKIIEWWGDHIIAPLAYVKNHTKCRFGFHDNYNGYCFYCYEELF